MGPFDQGGDFRDTGMEGMNRFLKRVWKLMSDSISILAQNHAEQKRKTTQKESVASRAVSRSSASSMMNETIKGVTEDMENLRYNTAISKLMIWYNFLVKQESISREEVEVYLKLLAPFAPHITEELWQMANGKWQMANRTDKRLGFESIHVSLWPTFDEKQIVHDVVNLAVQVNGKLRAVLVLNQDSPKDEKGIRELAMKDPRITKFLEGKSIKEVFYVVGKVLNFVVA